MKLPSPLSSRPCRRDVLAALAGSALALPLSVAAARAAPDIGHVERAVGEAFARLDATRRLSADAPILLGDLVWTGLDSRLSMALDGETRIHLGPKARLKVDRFVAETGGELVLGDGALIFDRADDLPKLDVKLRSTFGLIGVRGTRFFAGPSRGVFGVFVARGAVEVSSGGRLRRVEAGEGVDIAAPGAEPTVPKAWGQGRIDEALASVL